MASSFLEETLQAWRDVREGIVEELRQFSSAQLDYQPTEEVRTVRELVQHILEVSMMMTAELTRPDTDFRRKPWPQLLATYAKPAYRARTKADLIRLLKSTLREGEKKFRACGEIGMMQTIENFDKSRGTKMQWLHHGIAQEMYHRGQLALYLRLVGREPALTRRIRGG
jgi:uncharacterized damage-inducible protein DinB